MAGAARNLILVVDDEPEVREAVGELVRGLGHEVVALSDGQEALESLRRGLRPSVILLDLVMPRVDGVAFRKEQLADPAIAAVPLVLLANSASLKHLSSSVGVPILTKPVAREELERLLRGPELKAG